MNSKETKINIEVKIAEERVSLKVPFSRQNSVREIEAEIGLLLKDFRERFPGKAQKELLAMATYHYASNLYFLTERLEEESAAAEELLKEAERLCGEAESEQTDGETDEFDVY